MCSMCSSFELGSTKVGQGRNLVKSGSNGVKVLSREVKKVKKVKGLPWPILVAGDLVIVPLFRPLCRILMPENFYKKIIQCLK